MSNAIMCHVVAGYPDSKTCLELIRGLHDSGAAALEIQIPFSDPIADGETIMQANDIALKHGMTIARSFELIEQARSQGVESELYIMSYVQKVRHFGLEKFCKRAASCRVKGLIIPDLPYDSPEFSELHDLAAKLSLEVVPVVSPGMAEARLKAILAIEPPTLYVTSLRGITGNTYTPDRQLKQLITQIKELSDAKIMIGFGIATATDVRDASELGNMAVIGSAIINKLQSSGMAETIAYVQSLITD